MLILIKSLQNILKGLKISNSIFLNFKILHNVLIDKFILPPAPPPNKNLATALVISLISLSCKSLLLVILIKNSVSQILIYVYRLRPTASISAFGLFPLPSSRLPSSSASLRLPHYRSFCCTTACSSLSDHYNFTFIYFTILVCKW